MNSSEIIDKRIEYKQNMKLNDEIDRLNAMVVRAAIVAFVAVCIASICLMLFVRERTKKVTQDTSYCVLQDREWHCDYNLERLNKEAQEGFKKPEEKVEDSVVGTEPILVAL